MGRRDHHHVYVIELSIDFRKAGYGVWQA